METANSSFPICLAVNQVSVCNEIHPLNHPFSSTYQIQGSGGAGAYLIYHSVRGQGTTWTDCQSITGMSMKFNNNKKSTQMTRLYIHIC